MSLVETKSVAEVVVAHDRSREGRTRRAADPLSTHEDRIPLEVVHATRIHETSAAATDDELGRFEAET